MDRWALDDRFASMPWDSVDTVAFDVGGVLLSMNPDKTLESLFPGRSAHCARLKAKIIGTPYWTMLDRGTLTLEEAVSAMAGRDAALAPDIRRFMESWPEFIEPVEEGIEAAHACAAHGKRLLVLSNYQCAVFDRLWAKYDVFRLFEGAVVSSRVGLLKPEAAIYACARERFGLAPDRTLFIDDTAVNVEAALECGWRAIHFARAGQLRAFFAAEGLS